MKKYLLFLVVMVFFVLMVKIDAIDANAACDTSPALCLGNSDDGGGGLYYPDSYLIKMNNMGNPFMLFEGTTSGHWIYYFLAPAEGAVDIRIYTAKVGLTATIHNDDGSVYAGPKFDNHENNIFFTNFNVTPGKIYFIYITFDGDPLEMDECIYARVDI